MYNVKNDDEIKAVFHKISKVWDGLDIVIHAVAFAEREELKEAMPMMRGRNAAALTLSHYGAVKVFTNYNVMGVAKAALESSGRYLAEALGSEKIRVNAIFSGPIRTLSAFGVNGFSQTLDHIDARAPPRRNVTQEDVA